MPRKYLAFWYSRESKIENYYYRQVLDYHRKTQTWLTLPTHKNITNYFLLTRIYILKILVNKILKLA